MHILNQMMNNQDEEKTINWGGMVGDIGSNQYQERIKKLKAEGLYTQSIEDTVNTTIQNLQLGEGRSFVIFGEPQSGKTEMMIALNARLLDEGETVIVNLLTDSLDLLSQSLVRFRDSELSPSPKQFVDLPHDPKEIRSKKWVIFSKKNARDLEKLIVLLKHQERVIVIDDEADYASPNAKVNKDEKTKINELIHELIGSNGQYIGVTATPARLNLNNTFENNSELWVDFRPHPYYVGQDYFFPLDGKVNYRLHTFKADEGSERIELQNAILHFLCGVAEQHKKGVNENFTMLVHTSGKKDEHEEDIGVIHSTISILSNKNHLSFNKLVNKLLKIAHDFSPEGADHKEIVEFILRNIDRHLIAEINSKTTSSNVAAIAKPTSLFSFGAGGNIISRGVTFDNLLSMYFTRSVKGKFSQDTYIQRARMFGSREKFKNSFQLWIPDELLANWSKCFAFHKLAVDAVRSASGAPVWLADHKTVPTSSSSIDKSTVNFEGGEMAYGMFDYDAKVCHDLFNRQEVSDATVLEDLRNHFSEEEFPDYVYKFLKKDNGEIALHKPGGFGISDNSKYTEKEKRTISRDRGIFANSSFKNGDNPRARHHLKIFYNSYGKARLFYKINGGSIRFMQNKK